MENHAMKQLENAKVLGYDQLENFS